MPINLIDHYAIRTMDLGATKKFYVDVMGFEDGERPKFDFPGAWLYRDDRPIVHLIGVSEGDNQGFSDYMGEKHTTVQEGSGSVDHIAFNATDLAGLKKNLEQRKVPFFERTVPGMNLHQVFLEDPNGITIELNFPANEKG